MPVEKLVESEKLLAPGENRVDVLPERCEVFGGDGKYFSPEDSFGLGRERPLDGPA